MSTYTRPPSRLPLSGRNMSTTHEFSSLQHVKLWSTCVLFRRSSRLQLTSSAYPAININSCLQALTKDTSTPADIAPSALETIIFYCFIGCISALTYYLLLLITAVVLRILRPRYPSHEALVYSKVSCFINVYYKVLTWSCLLYFVLNKVISVHCS